MQEIKLKIKPNHFLVLQELLPVARIPFGQSQPRAENVLRSILKGVYKRIVNKAIDAKSEPNAKPRSFKLAYHEADALERILRANRGHYHTVSYEYNAIITIADELDQKLQ